MKKFKLFASLSALCLCIAVLCMGIYAAQTVSYTISGTISYKVEDVYANISAKVFKVSGKQDVSTMETNVNTLASKSLSSITSPYIDAGITITDFDTTSSASTSREVDITMDKTYKTYYVVINIKNLASEAINAQLTDTTSYTNLNTANKLIQNNIAKDDTKNLVVAFSVADEKVGISELAINYSIEVGYTEYSEPTFLDTLTADTTNSYWYVELGTLSDGTPIRWRVVSLDGTTKYTYSSTKPTIGTGTVFLQETYLGSKLAFDSDGVQNYYNSDIRTTINTLTTWNIQESDISSLIAKRNITSIDFYKYDSTSSSHIADSTKTALSGSTSDDYFWLMDIAEANGFLGTNDSERKWTPNNDNTSAVAWWLRSPYSYGTSDVYYVDTDGDFGSDCADISAYCAVRAAFQLA